MANTHQSTRRAGACLPLAAEARWDGALCSSRFSFWPEQARSAASGVSVFSVLKQSAQDDVTLCICLIKSSLERPACQVGELRESGWMHSAPQPDSTTNRSQRTSGRVTDGPHVMSTLIAF